jgi:hypothetical protein
VRLARCASVHVPSTHPLTQQLTNWLSIDDITSSRTGFWMATMHTREMKRERRRNESGGKRHETFYNCQLSCSPQPPEMPPYGVKRALSQISLEANVSVQPTNERPRQPPAQNGTSQIHSGFSHGPRTLRPLRWVLPPSARKLDLSLANLSARAPQRGRSSWDGVSQSLLHRR